MPGEQVAAPEAGQPLRRQHLEPAPDGHPDVGQGPEHGVVGDQPLGVAEEPAPDAEGADGHDGDLEGQDRRHLRRPGDEPAADAQQPDGADRRESARAPRPPRARHARGAGWRGRGAAASDRRSVVEARAVMRAPSRRGRMLPTSASAAASSTGDGSSTAPCASQRHDHVGGDEQGRPVRHEDHRAAGPAQRVDGFDDGLLGRPVEGRGRLVEQDERGVPAQRARQRDATHLSGGQPGPPSPTAVASPSGSVRATSGSSRSRPADASARRTSSSVASGAPSRTASATVPAPRYGACGEVGDLGPPARRGRGRPAPPRSRPVRGRSTAPSIGATNPMSSASSVDLPAPLAPARAVTTPGRTTRSWCRSAGAVRPGSVTVTSRTTISAVRRSGTSARTSRSCGSGVSSTASIRSAAPTPSAAAWKYCPTRRIGR